MPISGVGALAVLRYAGVHGLRVPQDMSLLAFDDLPGFDMHYPAITAIRNDGHTYARSVLQMLWTEEAGQTPRHKTIPLSLIVRESTAQAK